MQVDDRVFISGQIGLIPSSLTLPAPQSLALEAALGRQVVVKVLPPDLAAGVNRERFRREIQLAARLQHPHIVPLLAAGEVPAGAGDAGGSLYYTMPFIEGESLRAEAAARALIAPGRVSHAPKAGLEARKACRSGWVSAVAMLLVVVSLAGGRCTADINRFCTVVPGGGRGRRRSGPVRCGGLGL